MQAASYWGKCKSMSFKGMKQIAGLYRSNERLGQKDKSL